VWGKGMKSGFTCKSCAVWFALSSHLLTCCAERVVSRCFQLSVLWVLMSILRLLFILVIRCNLGLMAVGSRRRPEDTSLHPRRQNTNSRKSMGLKSDRKA